MVKGRYTNVLLITITKQQPLSLNLLHVIISPSQSLPNSMSTHLIMHNNDY